MAVIEVRWDDPWDQKYSTTFVCLHIEKVLNLIVRVCLLLHYWSVCHSIVLSKSISIITPAAWENAFCIYQNIFASLISIDLDDLGDYAVSASVELMKETNRAEKNTTDQSGRPLNLLKNY